MDIHAYSQLWMTPWGHGKGQYPPTYQEMVSRLEEQLHIARNMHGEYLLNIGFPVPSLRTKSPAFY